ncbi:MAG: GNAT family N-acetyltransferase [Chloroflexota bacterium]
MGGRAFGAPGDLARMQAALSVSWRLRGPYVNTGPGDLEWWQTLAETATDWSSSIRVWPDPDVAPDAPAEGAPLLAYAWLKPPDDLDWHQRADATPAGRATLIDEATGWAEETLRAAAAAGGIEPAPRLTTWALDHDIVLAQLLLDRGWSPADEPAYTHWYRTLGGDPADLPEPSVPAGYQVRHVRLPEELEARVEVHRAAFAPSRMTVEKYATLQGRAHYAPERDIVVEAPDGTLAAFALGWMDPVAWTGELEPVGTHPDHRRRGLALAASLAALRRLGEDGARGCHVLSVSGNAGSEALYAAAGFEAVSLHRAWTRPLGAG